MPVLQQKQTPRYFTLLTHRERLHECCLQLSFWLDMKGMRVHGPGYQVSDIDGCSVCGVAETPVVAVCWTAMACSLFQALFDLCAQLSCFYVNIGICTRDLRSFVIRFDFESYVRFEIRFVLMVRFEIFESSALSIVIRKETIGCR